MTAKRAPGAGAPERTGGAGPARHQAPDGPSGQEARGALPVEEAARELMTGVSLLGMRLRSLDRDRAVSAAGLGLLYRLHRYGPMGPSALAEFANRRPQTLTRTLAALEADRLIARRQDPGDARRSLVELTTHGRRVLYRDGAERASWLSAALESDCTEAERDLLRAAGRLMARLAERDLPPTGSGPQTRPEGG
jgi:DNA-binding MarR family transcriptional regulator